MAAMVVEGHALAVLTQFVFLALVLAQTNFIECFIKAI